MCFSRPRPIKTLEALALSAVRSIEPFTKFALKVETFNFASKFDSFFLFLTNFPRVQKNKEDKIMTLKFGIMVKRSVKLFIYSLAFSRLSRLLNHFTAVIPGSKNPEKSQIPTVGII